MTTCVEDATASVDETCDALATTRLGPGLQESYFSQHFAHLGGLWGPQVSVAMEREARRRSASATLPETGPRIPVSPERGTGKMIPVASGELLLRLHHAFVPLVRGLSARCLFPTFAAYGYYEGDDEVVLHVDGEPSDLVLLIPALGDVGPLHLHDELVGLSPVELGRLESDPKWDRTSGLPIVYPTDGVTAIRGNVVPHHRPGRPISQLGAVAALHYRSLF
jgi:hypothetical protein